MIPSVIAIAVALTAQSFFLSAISSIRDEASPVATTLRSAQTSSSSLGFRQSATLDNGVVVTTIGVRDSLENLGDSGMTEVSVFYTNEGTSNASFDKFGWKAESANGVFDSMAFNLAFVHCFSDFMLDYRLKVRLSRAFCSDMAY